MDNVFYDLINFVFFYWFWRGISLIIHPFSHKIKKDDVFKNKETARMIGALLLTVGAVGMLLFNA